VVLVASFLVGVDAVIVTVVTIRILLLGRRTPSSTFSTTANSFAVHRILLPTSVLLSSKEQNITFDVFSQHKLSLSNFSVE
jgi:hypothetical protein